MGYVPSPSYSLIVRVEIENRIGNVCENSICHKWSRWRSGINRYCKVEKGK